MQPFFFIKNFATSLANFYSNVIGIVSTEKREKEVYFTIHLIQSLYVTLSSDILQVSQELEVYGHHVSIKKVSNLSFLWPFGLCVDLLLYRSFLQEEKCGKINELQLGLTCFSFLLTIFFRYLTFYIDIKDGQLSLISVGIVLVLLVFLLRVAYKVLKFMVIMQNPRVLGFGFRA